MAKAKEIRSYDYVNHGYDQVRKTLEADALHVFQAATTVAATRAHSVASELRVNIAGIEVGTDIKISVHGITERPAEGGLPASTVIHLEWEAANMPRLFPFMKAELSLYPLTSTETQLDFLGHYEPPLGAIGEMLNAIAGHRIAEVSVHRFLAEVATHLRNTLD